MATPAYEQFRMLLAAHSFEEAATLAEQEYALSGGAFWPTQLSRALAGARRHLDALAAAEKALTAEPTNVYALLARADALRALERHPEACELYEEAARTPKVRDRALGSACFSLAASGVWHRILEIHGGEGDRSRLSPGPWIKALAGLGRTAEATEECRAWLARDRDNPRALWQLADLEVETEGLESVRERYGRLARIPSRPPIYREIYASLCRRAGEPEAAAAVYGALARSSPHPGAQRKAAFAMAKSGREEEAIPVFEELLREAPADKYVHSAYVAACRRLAELERTWRFYAELLALHPGEKHLYGRRKKIQRELEETSG